MYTKQKLNHAPLHETVTLPRGQLLTLADGRGTTLTVADGLLWVTEHRDRRDQLLSAGCQQTLERRGPVVISARRDSRVVVTHPNGRKAPTRGSGAWSLLARLGHAIRLGAHGHGPISEAGIPALQLRRA